MIIIQISEGNKVLLARGTSAKKTTMRPIVGSTSDILGGKNELNKRFRRS
jgi:hypothetical protein